MKQIKFIRANKTKFGGAEVYLSRLLQQLERLDTSHELIYSNIPKILPSWLRVLLFNMQVCVNKKDDIYFSLERISCPDIYRAGDGVHKVFVEVENKSKINPLHKVYIYLEERCFNNAKKIVANSNMIKQQIIDTYGIDEKKIEVIYNGIVLEKPNFKESYAHILKEFSIDKSTGQKIFLYVGSGFKRKGVEEFLIILSKLKFQNFKAFIIGKEKKIEYYKNLAKELNLEIKVIFTGPRNDVKDFYTVSDIFLFPTRYEPFSNVVLEAMNYSNVVITTKQNGASEIMNDKYTMTRPDDYTIVEKIDDLLINQEKIDKIKLDNLQIVKNFTIEKNVEKTLAVIEQIKEN
ncbi:MAG: glycosyltransferase family 4 protein [Arcobacteraceae bacterium]|nr:glycosyltransferase family 4 protein [Arcobacteraceae bacterium]